MAGRTSQPGQSVTGRVLSILAVFEDSLAPRSLTDLATETGLARDPLEALVPLCGAGPGLQLNAELGPTMDRRR